MPKFEVAIVYHGQTNYVVNAPDQETAERMAYFQAIPLIAEEIVLNDVVFVPPSP